MSGAPLWLSGSADIVPAVRLQIGVTALRWKLRCQPSFNVQSEIRLTLYTALAQEVRRAVSVVSSSSQGFISAWMWETCQRQSQCTVRRSMYR
jgi:hypothetical protein